MSDLAWRLGLETLSLRLLLFSLESNDEQLRIHVYNEPSKTVVHDQNSSTIFNDELAATNLKPWQNVNSMDQLLN